MSKTKRTISLEPNYDNLFRNMLQMAKDQCQPASMFQFLEPPLRAAALAEVQNFLAPLAIAANCATTLEAIEKFRDAIAGMSSGIAAAADAERAEELTDEQEAGIL